ncbi:MAG: polysaccharide biosynthesis/export family protein [Acidobacteriota bacterium]
MALLLSLGVASAQQRVTVAPLPLTTQPIRLLLDAQPESYRLGVSDSINVRCLNLTEFGDAPIRIDTDGQISLPLIGRIQAADLSVKQLEEELKKRLATYVLDPLVTVRLAEARSQPVSVIGAVNNPGMHQLEGSKTLLELLSLAGGLQQDAGRTVKLTRRREWGAIPLPGATEDETKTFSVAEIDLKQLIDAKVPAENIVIRPYDVISVPRAELVYVVGDVRRPGGFTLAQRESLSVLHALSLAEGLQPTATASKAKILRQEGAANRTEIPVNLAKILSGKDEDVGMRPGDILFVPNNKARSIGLKAIDSMLSITSGVLVYGRY